jgi:putative transposase
MTNHYHSSSRRRMPISPGECVSSTASTPKTTNGRHGLVGYLFQGRFKAILVERDAYLLELARYVVPNPVRAAMVSEAGDWPWSSYRAMVGQEPAPTWLATDWVLGQFGQERSRAQAGYGAFVRQGIGRPQHLGTAAPSGLSRR